MIQTYLLKVGEIRQWMEKTGFAGGAAEDAAMPGWDRLALWQREKVSCHVRPGAGALCMGGQLLLQYGAYKQLSGEKPQEKYPEEEEICWQQLTLNRLLEGVPEPLPLQVAYGSRGKPFLRHVPWHYNLSHSGEYAALAISDVPVGIDIQQMRPYRDSLVKRFFSREEAAAYEKLLLADIPGRGSAEGQQGGDGAVFFYKLWCRKEAYGKLLGTGLTEDVLKRNMLGDVGVHLYEYGELPDYCVCVCSGFS